jgi:hypothetical protein
MRYPGTYLAATVNNTFEYFTPASAMQFQMGLDLQRYIDFWLSRSLPGTTKQQIEAVAYALHPSSALVPVQISVNEATTAFISRNLLASKAFYSSWIPLLALGFALRRRSWLLALATVPLLINLAILVASPIPLPRYIIPSLLGSVLLVGLMLVPVRWQRARDAGGHAPGARSATITRGGDRSHSGTDEPGREDGPTRPSPGALQLHSSRSRQRPGWPDVVSSGSANRAP